MLNKHTTKIAAELKCPCLACLGDEVDSFGRKCVGCAGEGWFYIPVTESCLEDVRGWDDGPAWDFVATKVTEAGAEISEDAMQYRLEDEQFECSKDAAGEDIYNDETGKYEGRYVLTMKIVPYPISRENAAAMNAMVRK